MRQLSGGMKRRVLVAQALVHKPPVIVLDEPTAGVDVELRQTLWQFIAKLNKRRPHGFAHHPLSGRGGSPVWAHRHAQERSQGRGAWSKTSESAQSRLQQCACVSRWIPNLPPEFDWQIRPASPGASSSSLRTTHYEIERYLAADPRKPACVVARY
jgi:hypothetical protein